MFSGITRNHHFTFEKTRNKCKEFFDSDEMEFDSKIGPIPESDPEVISPIGLSLERKWYLFKQIRDLCTDPRKRDLVAPKPKERLQKEKKNKSEEGKPKFYYSKLCDHFSHFLINNFLFSVASNVKKVKAGNKKKSNEEVENEKGKPNAKKCNLEILLFKAMRSVLQFCLFIFSGEYQKQIYAEEKKN